MQAPVSYDRLSDSEMDLFQTAANLVSSAATSGEWKFKVGKGGGLVNGLKVIAFGWTGMNDVGDMGELAKQSASIRPSQDELENPKKSRASSAEKPDVPTFLMWASRVPNWVNRVVLRNLNNYRTATKDNLVTLYKIIMAGKSCYSQIPYGQHGKTQREVHAKLEKAQSIVVNLMSNHNLMETVGDVHQIDWY